MDLTIGQMVWIGLSILLMGMNKGGFPVGNIALPLLILVWPGDVEPAKTAVAFMLPLLCVMDIFGVLFYRKHIQWRRLICLMPGTVAGVAVASVVFVAKESALLSVPDRWLKLTIGILGIVFVRGRKCKRPTQRRINVGRQIRRQRHDPA